MVITAVPILQIRMNEHSVEDEARDTNDGREDDDGSDERGCFCQCHLLLVTFPFYE